MTEIYTIGYGNRKFEDFVDLLVRFNIEVVADVRRFPTSKRPEFVRENLQQGLSEKGITYVHLPGLGGYRRGYREHLKTEEFKRGLQELMKLARRKKVVIMCLEEYPSGCHRRHIAAELRRRRWRVLHVIRKGEIMTSIRVKRRSRSRADPGGQSLGLCRAPFR